MASMLGGLAEPAMRPVRAEQVAVPGDHPQLGPGADELASLLEVAGHDDPGQQPGQRGGQLSRRFHQLNGGHYA